MNLKKYKIKIKLIKNICFVLIFIDKFSFFHLSAVLFIYFLSSWFFFACSGKEKEGIDYTYSSYDSQGYPQYNIG